jgi:hypothetical protein
MNIDRIAREMVDVEPSAELEARIRARVRAEEPKRVSVWWVWRVAMPVAAVAAVVIMVFVLRNPGSEVKSPEFVTAGHSPTSQLPNVPTSEHASVPTSKRPNVQTSKRPNVPTSQSASVRTAQLSAEELAWMERRMPALDPLTALQVDHLRLDSIQPEPLAITPLTMPPVATEGSGIERRNDR